MDNFNQYNPNGFNTQGNNGIPNNQPLNNQGLNNAFNQNIYQNTNVNQQMYSNQQQSTINYQQPINQINPQQTTVQPMNTFENGNVNNQSFNNRPSKKLNLGLSIGIVLVVVVCIIVIVLLIPKSNSSNNGILGSVGNTISGEEISKYKLETDTIWINKPLGITYNIPKQISGSSLRGTSSYTYMHGSSFNYYSGYKIYVDKSLEGHNDLNTLASDIIKEKNSDKYRFVYEFGHTFLTEFKNEKTKNVKIGNINTVYFEGKEFSLSAVGGDELKVKLIGYSFKYNDEYISVYGELLVEEKSKIEDLKQMLQYIINSINNYNGELLEELGGNAKNYYDDGFANNSTSSPATTFITVNNYSSHVDNGILKTGNKTYGVDSRFCFEVPQDVNFNGGNIADLSLAMKTNYNDYWLKWVGMHYKYDIVKEEKLKFSDIEIKKYILKGYYSKPEGPDNIVSAYLFEVDNQHYVCQYELNKYIYNKTPLREMSDEQQQVVISQTETVSDAMMLTLRRLYGVNGTSNNVYKEQTKYVNFFS